MHGTSILKFEYNHGASEESEKHKLLFVEAFSNSQYLISPNDIIPISPRKFYFTNDHPTTNIFCQTLQDFLPQFFGNANVVLFDGVEPDASLEDIQGTNSPQATNKPDEWKVVIDGLQFANGINVSPDNKYLYVSETTGKRISVYKRRGISGTCMKHQSVRVMIIIILHLSEFSHTVTPKQQAMRRCLRIMPT